MPLLFSSRVSFPIIIHGILFRGSLFSWRFEVGWFRFILANIFEKFTGSENDWENYVDLGDEKRKEVLAAAYRQFMLNQVVNALELSLEGYKQDNLPWR